MTFKDFKTNPPAPGTRILAYSPVYPKGDPMRFRLVTVIPAAMDEVAAYMTEQDLTDAVMLDALFSN